MDLPFETDEGGGGEEGGGTLASTVLVVDDEPVVRDWERKGDYRKRGEIAEVGMFARQDVPAETDAGTRTRLAEIFERSPISQLW